MQELLFHPVSILLSVFLKTANETGLVSVDYRTMSFGGLSYLLCTRNTEELVKNGIQKARRQKGRKISKICSSDSVHLLHLTETL